MKTLNNNTQTLNITYAQALSPDVLNKIFYNAFMAGVIEGTFEFSSTTVTISSVAFLIHPQNQPDIIVRIDTTESITITNTSPSNIYLIARYRWENPNVGAEFLFADDATIVGTDVILVGLILDGNGNIAALDYDARERARLKIIQTTTTFPLISQLDGYAVGHGSGYIPISDGELNEGLNAQYFNGKDITKYAVSKEASSNTFDEETGEQVLITPTYPDWMDVEAVSLGDGITSEYLMGYKVQPQDGTTEPGDYNQIPVANGLLQKNLNATFLDGHTDNEFAKSDHGHTLDDIIDGCRNFNSTCTLSIGPSATDPCIVTIPAHGFLGDEAIAFSTTGALPTGITVGQLYYVKYIDADTFNFSDTFGGANIIATGTQSGIHTCTTVLLYNRVFGVVSNVITGDSIEDDGIDYTKVDRLAYDAKLGAWFQPVYETGKITLTGLTESIEIPFTRTLNNARVVLQRAPKSTEVLAAGAEKRTARVTEITTTGFKAKQMSSIIKSGSNYIKQEASDAAANQYYWFAIGEAL